jgi:hypothetical protein
MNDEYDGTLDYNERASRDDRRFDAYNLTRVDAMQRMIARHDADTLAMRVRDSLNAQISKPSDR